MLQPSSKEDLREELYLSRLCESFSGGLTNTDMTIHQKIYNLWSKHRFETVRLSLSFCSWTGYSHFVTGRRSSPGIFIYFDGALLAIVIKEFVLSKIRVDLTDLIGVCFGVVSLPSLCTVKPRGGL